MASRARCRPDKGGLVCGIAVRADQSVPVPDTEYRPLIPVFRNQVRIERDAILREFAELEADPGKPLLKTPCGCSDRRVDHIQIHDGALSPKRWSANRNRRLRNREGEGKQPEPNTQRGINENKQAGSGHRAETQQSYAGDLYGHSVAIKSAGRVSLLLVRLVRVQDVRLNRFDGALGECSG